MALSRLIIFRSANFTIMIIRIVATLNIDCNIHGEKDKFTIIVKTIIFVLLQ